jgi:hypothetical protein
MSVAAGGLSFSLGGDGECGPVKIEKVKLIPTSGEIKNKCLVLSDCSPRRCVRKRGGNRSKRDDAQFT